jgi:hypothetical protein
MKTKLSRCLVLMALLAGAAATLYAGGWSIITLADFPDRAVAGERLTLMFSVRQHGNNLIEGLTPAVQASIEGGAPVHVVALPTTNRGEYTATLRLPKPGEWTVRIDGGFNPEDKTRAYNAVTMPPLRVVRDASENVPALSEADRGSRLFIAKGCVGCHGAGSEKDLSRKQFASDYLKKVLADPSIRTTDMPNLKLKDAEISALSAFINRASAGKKGGN